MFRRGHFVVLLALSTTLQLAGPAAAETPNSIALTSPAAKGAKSSNSQMPQFNQFVDDYFAASFKANPNLATASGIHDYDGQLDTVSKEAVAQRILELKKLEERNKSFNPDKLDYIGSQDRVLISNDAHAQLLELETIQNWKRNPDMYSSQASADIFSLMKRNFATPAERLKSVISREKLIPELLSNGKKNLENTPKIYTEVAIEQLPGIIDFFQTQVPASFAAVTDAQLQKDFAQSNANVVTALKDYQQFLKTDVLPRSIDNFAIGKDNYQKKLLYEEMVSESLESLLDKGNTELKRLQKSFLETAKQIDPGKDPHALYASLSSEHPKPDQLIASVTNVLASLRERSKTLVTIPGEANLTVQETPPFMRAVTFASMDSPGPLETKATEAFYQVTIPEKDWSATKTEEHMRFFCDKDLINTSVHEAYPGHYVQGLWMRLAPSKTRKLLYSGSNSEGWAHYCEEMMADEGAPDPKLKLVQLHDALLRAARYMVGIRMHTQGMTMDQAREFFVTEGFQEKANADRETKRGTMDPTYLVYTLGKLQILALRDDYKKSKGAEYSLKSFHDAFLGQGCPPVEIVRAALLNKTSKK